jgi:hypothetical protein
MTNAIIFVGGKTAYMVGFQNKPQQQITKLADLLTII